MQQRETFFEEIGKDKIDELVEAFYKRVQQHPDLIPIFPDDFTETIRKQKQFLTQFFGGPPLYVEEHGHPMLRARHLPFKITPARRDAWLSCMSGAMTEVDIQEPHRSFMFERLTMTANHMMNSPDDEKGESM